MPRKKASTTKAKKKTTKAVTVSRAIKVRKEVIDLRKTIETNYLELAKRFSEIREKQYYRDYGFQSFASYCEMELGIKSRRAIYLSDIWNMVSEYHLSIPQIRSIGWTKAKELTRVLTADNAKELIALAKDMSVGELQQEVRKLASPGVTVTPPPTTLTKIEFRLDESEADVITSALEAAKSMIETENGTTALEHICSTWLQEHEDAAPPSVESIIAYVKRVFGVDLVEATTIVADSPDDATEQLSDDAGDEQQEEGDDPLVLLDKLRTKKQLRAFIKDNALGVRISRKDKIADIKNNIRDAMDAIAGSDSADEPSDEDIEVDEEDINAILGIG